MGWIARVVGMVAVLALLAASGCGSSESSGPAIPTPTATPASTPTASPAPTPTVAAAAGELDPSFGEGGIAPIDFGAATSRVSDVASTLDGRIVVAGSALDDAGASSWSVARLRSDGSADPTFGEDGVVRTDVASRLGPCDSESCADSASAVLVRSDGVIVAAGTTRNDGEAPASRFALAAYRPDGTLDPDFGDAGVTTTALEQDAVLQALALDSEGRLVAAGGVAAAPNAISDPVVARYQPSGELDPSFASGGVVVLPALPDVGPTRSFTDVAIGPADSIVAAGRYSLFSDFARLVGFTAEGELDANFGEDGIVAGFPALGWPGNLAFFPEGQIVVSVGGYPSPDQFLLARFTSAGVLDTEFGDDGAVLTGSKSPIVLAVDAAGRIVLAGTTETGALLLERRTADGTRDPTFGDGGVATIAPPGEEGRALSPVAIAIQPDGRIIVAVFAPDPSPEPSCFECGGISAVVRVFGDAPPR